MTSSYTPTTVAQGFGQETAINTNFTAIKTALDESKSRVSTISESMQVDLDMNSNDILNALSVSTDVLNIQGVKVAVTALNAVNAVKFYTTVANMKLATDHTLGDLLVTEGFTAAGDGGHAAYLVVAPQAADGFADHVLANSNIAVLQTVDEVNVKQFGAVGDSVVDDTTEIQAAIDYVLLNGLNLFLPAGNYSISATLNVATTVSDSCPFIRGAGRFETTVTGDFTPGSVSPLFYFSGNEAADFNFLFSGGLASMKLVPGSGQTNLGGVRVLGWWYGELKDVWVSGFDVDGLWTDLRVDIDANPDFYATIGLKVTACLFESTRFGVNQKNGVGSSGWEFRYSQVAGADLGAMIISGHHTRLISQGFGLNSLNAAAGAGFNVKLVNINGAPQHTLMQHCEFDVSKDNHIIIESASGTYIHGCRFITNDRFNLSAVTPLNHINVTGVNLNMQAENNFHRVDDNFGTPVFYNDPGAGNSTGARVSQVRIEASANPFTAQVGWLREDDNDVRILETLPITAKFLQATLTSGVSITGSLTALVFDDVDPAGQTQYATGTFTASVTGRYRVRCALGCTVVGDTQIVIDNRINAATTNMKSTTQCLAGSSNHCVLHGVADLTAGDTMVIRAQVISGTAFNLDSTVAYEHTLEIGLI